MSIMLPRKGAYSTKTQPTRSAYEPHGKRGSEWWDHSRTWGFCISRFRLVQCEALEGDDDVANFVAFCRAGAGAAGWDYE